MVFGPLCIFYPHPFSFGRDAACAQVAEGSTVLAGYGFEGYAAGPNGKESPTPKGWAGVSNMDILGFELAENLREQSRAWNQGTQKWLERYVYSRFNNNTVR
jgi:lysophospholipid acyltransferase